jgi:hypothetical protein
MIELTLAQAFEQKFRLEFFGENDSRAYFEHDALILQIKTLLMAHPFLVEVLSEKDYSILKILDAIAVYFAKIRKERGIDEYELQKFIKTHQRYRISETLTLLLMIGFSFNYAFIRITNNRTMAGDKFIFEKDDDSEGLNLDYEYVMPEQEKNNHVIELFKLVENKDAPRIVIENVLLKIQTSLKNRKKPRP